MNINWISLHIFYASNPNPVIVECIAPLIENLRSRGLIQRYFFIRYWQEGPHIRLRLLPTDGVEHEEIKQVFDPAINTYLKLHPALYKIDHDRAKSFYKKMFITEYGEGKWREEYGENEEMPLRPNNSLHYMKYEPEYDRYGGPDGVDVAEWHFEKSSEIVTRLIRDTNIHVRPVMLGASIQLSLPLCYIFLEEDFRVIDFLNSYIEFWLNHYYNEGTDPIPGFEKAFSRMASQLQRRILEIRSYMMNDIPGGLTNLEREWIAHIRELRRRIDALFTSKKLFFQDGNKATAMFTVDNSPVAFQILLSSYIHMNNNRLGVLVRDETYLSYLLKRTLQEMTAMARGVAS